MHVKVTICLPFQVLGAIFVSLLFTQSVFAQSTEEQEESFPTTMPATSFPSTQPSSAPVVTPVPPSTLPVTEVEAIPKSPSVKKTPPSPSPGTPLDFQLEQPQNSLISFSSEPIVLNFFVQIQAQAALLVGNETFLEEDSAAIQEGYRVRRARVGLWGEFLSDFGYVMTLDLRDETLPEGAGLDANPVGARLLDAAISWKRFPGFVITAGASKMPFSRGAMASSFTTTFLEAPFSVSRLSPGRRAGITLSGNLNKFSYFAGQYNTSDSLTFGSLGGGLLSLGRVELSPLGPIDPNQSGPRDFEGLRFSLGGGGYFAAGETQNTFAANADLLIQSGPFTALFEVIASRIEPLAQLQLPGGVQDTTDRLGAYGQIALMAVPELLEIAVRSEIFDDNLALRDEGDILALTGGINILAYQNRIRAGLDFTKRIELGGSEFSNDLLLLEVGARF